MNIFYLEIIVSLLKELKLSPQELTIVLEAFMMNEKEIKKYVEFIKNMNNSFTDVGSYLSNIDSVKNMRCSSEKLINTSLSLNND